MFSFLIQAIAISLSGVMAPGPMTAAALAAGIKRRHAGFYMSLGHAVVEFPLMILIACGAGRILEREVVRAAIGIAGGCFLILMGIQLMKDVRRPASGGRPEDLRHPFIVGIILSGGNPYFLLWWATVGLALATGAAGLGAGAFVIFAIVHWLCDLFWLEALTLAGYKGRDLAGGRARKAITLACAVTVLGFGAKFIIDAARRIAI